jgi:hypothetical protein
MRQIRKHRPSRALALSTVALLATLGGVAWASIPSPKGIIYACYDKRGGQLRVINTAAHGKCRHREAPLSWTETGARGQRGARGVTGTRGVMGPRGSAGPTGPAGAPGATGAQGPSTAYAASLTEPSPLASGAQDILSRGLPAGKFVVTASVDVANASTSTEAGEATCVINSVPKFAEAVSASTTIPFVKGLSTSETLTLDGTWSLPAPAGLELSCSQSSGTTSVSSAQIDAIQVAEIVGS